MRDPSAIATLLEEGLLSTDPTGQLRETRRWQAAVARAALRLVRAGERREDLRIPYAMALLEIFDDLDNQQLADLIEQMLAIETEEHAPTAVP